MIRSSEKAVKRASIGGPLPGDHHADSDEGSQRPFTISTISAKVLMALTGLALLGFVSFHMLGNLQVFLGQDRLNAYAAFLKGTPLLLWTARIGLLTVFLVHIGLAVYLKLINRAARPLQYVCGNNLQATFASRTMLLSGLVIFAFVIYHLLHFTLGVTNPTDHELIDAKGRHDVYSMVVLGFQNVFISATYVTAMAFLGLHLSHAASSIFQTLGLNGSRWRKVIHRAGLSVTAAIVIGNCSIPIAVLLGLVTLPTGISP